MTCADAAGVGGMMQAFLSEQPWLATAVRRLVRGDTNDDGPATAAASRGWPNGDRRVKRAANLMQAHVQSPLPISTVARQAGVSERELERLFRKEVGCAPQHYYLAVRLNQARLLLTSSAASVFDVASRCGFSDTSHLARHFRRAFDETPVQARRRAASRPLARIVGSVPNVDESMPRGRVLHS
jgi:transcriptional regulator GlxA family with amidase domain